MNLGDIEQRVAGLDAGRGFDLLYDLLLAYGLPKASIARLRNGSHNRSDREDERLWKGKVYYRLVQGTDDLHDVIDDASRDPRILREHPRFLIVRDSDRLLALDTRNDATLDTTLVDLPSYFEFFLPWAGIEKTQLENLNYADVKAAEKMARLYDEIITRNKITTATDVHNLNVFFSRLLFCFFAEDTNVFEPGQFTNAIASMTNVNGEDVNTLLDDMFKVLNTEQSGRGGLPVRFRDFGYVNGNLFNQESPSPIFSPRARKTVLECGTLDWSQINPDIFGSMIQAVVHPGQRESLGIHYTSVENIMRVIRPLFLDDLHVAFDAAADSAQKLQRLLTRICAIKVFDPACGSGNFLVIAYKELRKLEHRILQRMSELDPNAKGLFSLSRIKLENFYGIEIDDFAHEIAILSLWLAKHQMNVEFHELFGVEISLIPLKDTGNIACGNAARMDWHVICPSVPGDKVYVLGNPPYQGGTKQSREQKEDLAIAFEDDTVNKYLDYVSIWLFKGARFVMKYGAELGFVTTNSVCQGNHVGLLWPRMQQVGAEISFAHAPFRWSNSAKGNAGVTCVVIGLAQPGQRKSKLFYVDGLVRQVSRINSYLLPDVADIVVVASDTNLAGLPAMVFGSMPRDGGHLLFEPSEWRAMVDEYPDAAKLIRRFVGATELIDGKDRYCLWIGDEEVAAARAIPAVQRRLERVRSMRLASKAGSTKKLADAPHRFAQCAHLETPSIIVPCHSSEKREYIPMGFLDHRTVISNAALAIYDAEPWVFGLLQSRMHMTWMRAVAGRLETRYRYSAEIVYNTFPIPVLSSADKKSLTDHVVEVLDAREQFSGNTLAELYDPSKMPGALRQAHHRLDATVDGMYRKADFATDEERLELLFQMYEKMIAAQAGVAGHA